MNRGVITAVLKWRGRSPVERAAAAPFPSAILCFIGAAIPKGDTEFEDAPRRKFKNCLRRIITVL